MPAGSVGRPCLASATPDASEEPSVTVPDHERIRPKPHRSFGGGVHRCLGKSLARMELAVIVAEWLSAVPDFDLEPGFTPRFTFTQGGAIMPSSLPLRWGNRSLNAAPGLASKSANAIGSDAPPRQASPRLSDRS